MVFAGILPTTGAGGTQPDIPPAFDLVEDGKGARRFNFEGVRTSMPGG